MQRTRPRASCMDHLVMRPGRAAELHVRRTGNRGEREARTPEEAVARKRSTTNGSGGKVRRFRRRRLTRSGRSVKQRQFSRTLPVGNGRWGGAAPHGCPGFCKEAPSAIGRRRSGTGGDEEAASRSGSQPGASVPKGSNHESVDFSKLKRSNPASGPPNTRCSGPALALLASIIWW